MTRDDYIHISVVLDQSGSMHPIGAATCSAFNEFVQEQRRQDGRTTLSLRLFDSSTSQMLDVVDITDVPELVVGRNYQPAGMTALHDAVALTIESTGARLAGMPEDQRPGRVLMVIQTDGHENASTDYRGQDGRQRVAKMRDHQEQEYGWTFLFLGANQDAWDNPFGIQAVNTVSYDGTPEGARAAGAMTSNYTSKVRSAPGGQSVTVASAAADLREGGDGA